MLCGLASRDWNVANEKLKTLSHCTEAMLNQETNLYCWNRWYCRHSCSQAGLAKASWSSWFKAPSLEPSPRICWFAMHAVDVKLQLLVGGFAWWTTPKHHATTDLVKSPVDSPVVIHLVTINNAKPCAWAMLSREKAARLKQLNGRTFEKLLIHLDKTMCNVHSKLQILQSAWTQTTKSNTADTSPRVSIPAVSQLNELNLANSQTTWIMRMNSHDSKAQMSQQQTTLNSQAIMVGAWQVDNHFQLIPCEPCNF